MTPKKRPAGRLCYPGMVLGSTGHWPVLPGNLPGSLRSCRQVADSHRQVACATQAMKFVALGEDLGCKS